ncbi:uncharacterized protein [Amphiura filiformis]|uniref:uncharacterized protein n=1 Tax=Amphiura filiformis TaxID=82378 RepID=UPI003B21617F
MEQPVFQGLNSNYRLKNSWAKSFNNVEPVKIKLNLVSSFRNKKKKRSSSNQTTGSYAVQKQNSHGYYVPVLKSLQALLCCPSVSKHILTHNVADFGKEECMTDVFDGEYFQSDPYLRKNPGALVFALYSDDFEVANPIGHHRKTHKLTSFYYVLLNIPPYLRTKLEAIQLVAMVKTTDVKKHGLSKILKNFIKSMQKLQNGVYMATHSPTGASQKTLIRGKLGFVLGDVPAAHLLGGFKESVGHAHKPCQSCEITKEELRNNSVTVPSAPRDEDEHLERCDVLNTEMSQSTRDYWSKMYGVTRRSELLDVPHFMATKCILHDPMHILLEGIVPQETKRLLVHCVENRYFTIEKLNSIIRNFEYTYDERKDKPVEVSWQNVQSNTKFNQTAQSMKNLLVLLPFLLKHHNGLRHQDPKSEQV